LVNNCFKDNLNQELINMPDFPDVSELLLSKPAVKTPAFSTTMSVASAKPFSRTPIRKIIAHTIIIRIYKIPSLPASTF
jgi:hypothetical protein